MEILLLMPACVVIENLKKAVAEVAYSTKLPGSLKYKLRKMHVK
jgi:hypothetical protein